MTLRAQLKQRYIELKESGWIVKHRSLCA